MKTLGQSLHWLTLDMPRLVIIAVLTTRKCWRLTRRLRQGPGHGTQHGVLGTFRHVLAFKKIYIFVDLLWYACHFDIFDFMPCTLDIWLQTCCICDVSANFRGKKHPPSVDIHEIPREGPEARSTGCSIHRDSRSAKYVPVE